MQAGQDSDGRVGDLEEMCTLHVVSMLWDCFWWYGQLSRRSSIQGAMMKYLVFGIISSSLLSELQVMIPKVERNGVCVCMVYPTLWPGGTAECVYRPPLSLSRN